MRISIVGLVLFLAVFVAGCGGGGGGEGETGGSSNPEPVTYQVSASADEGGSITPSSQVVAHGSTTSFAVTPKPGFEIFEVRGCGGSLSQDQYTTSAITEACTVTAEFLTVLPPLVEVTPMIELPVNRQGLQSDDLQTRSLLSEEKALVYSRGTTLLIAEDDLGRAVLLGMAMPSAEVVDAEGDVPSPSLSPESTVFALVMTIAGSGLADDGLVMELASIIREHPDYRPLVDEVTEILKADAYLLETIGRNQALAERIKGLAHSTFATLLQNINPEGPVVAPAFHGQILPMSTVDTSSTTLGKSFCTWISSWLCASPWRAHEPWDWYGEANTINVWAPPFLAVETHDRSHLAIANPSLVNFSVQFYDGQGELLDWRLSGRNSTAIQKVLQSGASQRRLRVGGQFPVDTAHVEFHKYRFKFNDLDLGAPQVSALNFLHLFSSALSIASSAHAAHFNDVVSKAEETPGGLDALICFVDMFSGVDIYQPDPDVEDAGGAVGQLFYDNWKSIAESVSECGLSLLVTVIGEQLAQEALDKALTAGASVAASASNPAGWAIMAFNAANSFGPFTVSYAAWSNNRAMYQVQWNDGKIINIAPASTRPMPSGPDIELPVARFVTSGNEGLGLTVSFDASESTFDAGANPAFYWGLGDGTLAQGNQVTHTYTSPGRKNIRLTIYDGLGHSDEVLTTIEVGRGQAPMIHSLTCSIDPDNARRVRMTAEVSDPDDDLQRFSVYRSASDSQEYVGSSPESPRLWYVDYPDDGIDVFNPALVLTDAAGNRAIEACSVGAGDDGLGVGLIAHWPFNGNAADTSGNGRHGVMYGPVPAEDRFGKPGRALSFNGISDYISVPHNAAFNLVGDYTFSVWFYQRSAGPGGQRLINKVTAGACNGWNLDTYDGVTGRKIRMNVGCPWVNADRVHELNMWNHVVVSVANGVATFYLNGEPNGGGAVATTPVNSLDVWIGRSTNYNYFDGIIDDLRVYNRALSFEEVSDMYRFGAEKTDDLLAHYSFDEGEGSSIGDAWGGKDFVSSSPDIWSESGLVGSALDIAGRTDFAVTRAPDLDFSVPRGTEITLSAWVLRTEGGASQIILSRGRNTLGEPSLVWFFSANDRLGFSYCPVSPNLCNVWNSQEPVTQTSAWEHFALTYTYGVGESLRAFRNGQALGGGWVVGDGNVAPANENRGLRIGSQLDASDNLISPLRGRVDELMLWKGRTLAPSEIRELYINP